VKVLVLTTSYPRAAGDVAGRFVRDAVEQVRARGVEVEVVSPATFRHYGIAYGAGIVGNVRRRPWLAFALPLFLLSFLRAARRAAPGADLVHAHWLPSGLIGLLTRKPTIVHLWGTDVELARRLPWLARPILRRASLVVAPSSFLAGQARTLGVHDVRVIPGGVDVPPATREPDDPPTVLYAGRLSPEKGILELIRAADGISLVVAGDGPLRGQVPQALGFVSHEALAELYDRSAIVACPSWREGFGMACAEAMAHGRPVVATSVGGFLDLVDDGETGLLVAPGDVDGLRVALRRLLDDPELRVRMGEAGRVRIRDHFSWRAVTDATLEAYAEASRSPNTRSVDT
jgi:glycosyltransferase involved in cell wall biosynthesis